MLQFVRRKKLHYLITIFLNSARLFRIPVNCLNQNLLTRAKLDTFEITSEQISHILIGLTVNKAHGSDDISVNMIKLCRKSLVVPLKINIDNILRTMKFPKQWKIVNVTPVHKKENKLFIKNYRSTSLLPIFAKLFEKIIFMNLYNHLVRNKLKGAFHF